MIPEIHWHWVVPAYLPLEAFIFGKNLEWFPAWQTCEVPATASGNHFRTVVCLDSLDSLDMFICCTGIRLLVEEQKMAGTVFADLNIPEIRLSVTTAVSSGENSYLPICRSLHLLGPFVQRC